MTIGEAIKKVREGKGIPQSHVEKTIGLKAEYLSKIENNHHKNPTFKMLLRIAGVLDIRLSELVVMTEN